MVIIFKLDRFTELKYHGRNAKIEIRMPCKELIARGRVRGVGFRWFVMQRAIRHQVTGYVQNKTDGSVYIIACGEDVKLTRFIEQVRSGTYYAVVESLEEAIIEHCGDFDEFSIR